MCIYIYIHLCILYMYMVSQAISGRPSWVVILQHPNPKVKEELEKLAGHPSKLGLGHRFVKIAVDNWRRQRGWQSSVTSERASKWVSEKPCILHPISDLIQDHGMFILLIFCSIQMSAWTGNVAEWLSCVSASRPDMSWDGCRDAKKPSFLNWWEMNRHIPWYTQWSERDISWLNSLHREASQHLQQPLRIGWSLQDTNSTLDEDAMLRLLDVPEGAGEIGKSWKRKLWCDNCPWRLMVAGVLIFCCLWYAMILLLYYYTNWLRGIVMIHWDHGNLGVCSKLCLHLCDLWWS